MSKPRIKTLLIAVPLLAFTILLATAMLAGGGAGGVLQSGRSVMANSDTIWLSSTFSYDTATIEMPGKKIVVNPTSLVVDGVTVAKIDKDAADVQVRVKRGVVTLVADGAPVPTLPGVP
ncbi:MAG: hypothetical protein WEB58_23250 [Planctomycetaceae bacterium]